MPFSEGQPLPPDAMSFSIDSDAARRRAGAEQRVEEEEKAILLALRDYRALKREAGKGKHQEKLIMQDGSPGAKANSVAPSVPRHALGAALIEFVHAKYRLIDGENPEPPFFPEAEKMGEKLHPQTGDPIVAQEFHPKDGGQPHWDTTEDHSEIYFLEQGQSGVFSKKDWYAYLKAHYRRNPARAPKTDGLGGKITLGKAPLEMYGLSFEFSAESPEERNRRYEESKKK